MKRPWFLLCSAFAAGCLFADCVSSDLFFLIFLFAVGGAALCRRGGLVLGALLMAASFAWCMHETASVTAGPYRFAARGRVVKSEAHYYDLSAGIGKRTRVLSESMPPAGTEMVVRGPVRYPERPKNPGQPDDVRYALSRGIVRTIRPVAEEMLSKAETDPPGSLLAGRESLVRRLRGVFDRHLPPRDADVLSAMVLGTRAEAKSTDSLRTLDLVHILSVSGLHIGVWILLWEKVLRRLTAPVAFRVLWIHLFLAAYLFLADFPVGGMRIWAMVLFRDLARAKNVPADPMYALFFSAGVFLLCNPFYIFHRGFLFSFFSVYGLFFLYPKLRPLLPTGGVLRDGLVASVSVTALIAPLLLETAGGISWAGILANVVVLPAASIVLIGGILLLGFAAIAPPLALGTAFFLHLVLSALFGFTDAIAMLSSSWVLPAFSLPESAAYIAAIHAAVLFPWRRLTQRAGRVLILQAVGVAFAALSTTYILSPPLTITQLYVGQGDCAFVRSGDFCALIDTGGSAGANDPARRYVLPFLRNQGVGRLDAVVLSHYDMDHAQGIFSIKDAVPIDAVYGPAADGNDALFREIERVAGRVHTAPGMYKAGQGRILLYPSVGRGDNAASMVAEVFYGENAALFMGDLPQREEEILFQRPGKRGIVKLGHHGSRTSTGEAFLINTRPDLALISAGKDNPYGHPHEEVLERLKEHRIPYKKTEDGAVRMDFYGDSIAVDAFRTTRISMARGMIFFLFMVLCIGIVRMGAEYCKKREEIWTQWTIRGPISSTGRKNTVWRSGAEK